MGKQTVFIAIYLYLLFVNIASLQPNCPFDWLLLPDGKCFFGLPYKDSFYGAEAFCRDYFSGHTASITNDSENERIQWLFKYGEGLVWLGGYYDGVKVQWNDGSPDVYQKFRPGAQPGHIIMDLATGLWFTDSTSSWNANLSFVCLVVETQTTTPTPSAITTSIDSCPPLLPCPTTDWTYSPILKYCYKPIFNVNFTSGNQKCRQMGATLASIHSDDENRLVNDLLKTEKVQSSYHGEPLIGAQRTGLGPNDWKWSDGTSFDFSIWAKNEPNNGAGNNNENCIQVYVDLMNDKTRPEEYLTKWNDIPCELQFWTAICKIPANF